MAKSVRTYQREIRSLRGLLEDVMWVMPKYNGSHSCSYCGNQRHMGHDGYCTLGKMFPQDQEEIEPIFRKESGNG